MTALETLDRVHTSDDDGVSAEHVRRAAARGLVASFKEEYPWEGRWLDVDGHGLHFLDVGPRDAAPLLCLHGNPSWSFLWRALVREFQDEHRLVVPDHLGCGLSEKPQDYAYTLANHAENLEQLVVELDLRNVTLVVHDWGGAIGMALARRQPERIARLVVTNTAAFRSKAIPLRIAACRVPLLGRLAVRGLNGFARAATFMAVERPLTSAARRGLLAPYDSWANRIATHEFVRDIPLAANHRSWAELEATELALEQFRELPTCLVWGERDWCFTPAFREEWQRRFPGAEAHRLEDAGHYLLEDAPERVTAIVRDFLARHPLP